jgi:hypothetical protein
MGKQRCVIPSTSAPSSDHGALFIPIYQAQEFPAYGSLTTATNHLIIVSNPLPKEPFSQFFTISPDFFSCLPEHLGLYQSEIVLQQPENPGPKAIRYGLTRLFDIGVYFAASCRYKPARVFLQFLIFDIIGKMYIRLLPY